MLEILGKVGEAWKGYIGPVADTLTVLFFFGLPTVITWAWLTKRSVQRIDDTLAMNSASLEIQGDNLDPEHFVELAHILLVGSISAKDGVWRVLVTKAASSGPVPTAFYGTAFISDRKFRHATSRKPESYLNRAFVCRLRVRFRNQAIGFTGDRPKPEDMDPVWRDNRIEVTKRLHSVGQRRWFNRI